MHMHMHYINKPVKMLLHSDTSDQKLHRVPLKQGRLALSHTVMHCNSHNLSLSTVVQEGSVSIFAITLQLKEVKYFVHNVAYLQWYGMTYWWIGGSNVWLFDSPCYSWSHWWVFCLPILVPCCGNLPCLWIISTEKWLMNTNWTKSAHVSMVLGSKLAAKYIFNAQTLRASVRLQCWPPPARHTVGWTLFWHTADCESAHAVHGLMLIDAKWVFNSEPNSCPLSVWLASARQCIVSHTLSSLNVSTC